jgi:hypothetical protein
MNPALPARPCPAVAEQPTAAKAPRTQRQQDVPSAARAAAARNLLCPDLTSFPAAAWQLLADLYEAAGEEDVVQVVRLRRIMACPGEKPWRSCWMARALGLRV